MKKILFSLVVLFVVFMIAAIAIPVIYKDRIIKIVKDEMNKNLDATVEFNSLDLSLLRSIPDLSLTISDISIVGQEEFAKDTLIKASSISLRLDILSVLRGEAINVKAVDIDKPDIKILVLNNGKANYDIYKETEDEAEGTDESSEFRLKLKGYSIKEANLDYKDLQSSFRINLKNFEHKGSGNFTSDQFDLNTNTKVDKVNLWQGGIHYVLNASAEISSDFNVNNKTGRYDFEESKIKLNELDLLAEGFVEIGDDIDMDIRIEALGSEFKNFLSMVPGVYREGFEDATASGTMAFDAYLKGSYSDDSNPGYGINLKLENGGFKYPDLKSDVKNINVDLLVDNKTGKSDNTVIELKTFHAEIANESIDARLVVRNPETDPDIDGMLVCNLNLANIKSIVPLDEGTKLNGLVEADLQAKGRLSALENKDYQNFSAKGSLKIEAMDYDHPDLQQAFRLMLLSLSFNPSNVAVHEFNASYGLSDFQANGSIDNLLLYALKDEKLKGRFNLFSKKTDLNDMMPESTPSTEETNPNPTAINVPANLDIIITSSITRLLYDDLVLQNVMGTLIVKERVISMDNLNFDLLDGRVNMSGSYSSKTMPQPIVDFNLKVTEMDIKKTYEHFITVNKLVPIAAQCQGRYSADMVFSSTLDKNMEPIASSMAGKGRLRSNAVSIQGAAVLEGIASAVKINELRSTILKNVDISFEIKDGRLHVDKFSQNFSGINASIVGSNGIDQTIDYEFDLEVPKGLMSEAAMGNAQSLVDQFNSSAGSNLSIGNNLNLKVLVAGTVSDPVIKTGLAEGAADLKEDLKEQVKDVIDTKKQELEDQATEEIDKLKKEAEDKINEEQEKLRREAELKKQEAEQRAKEEAEKQKKAAEEKAKKEAEEAIKNVFKKPK